MTPEDRRSLLLDRVADFLLAEGLGAASLRPLAEAADTSDRMLLYYFKDKAELIAAALERIAVRLTQMLQTQAAQTPLPPAELRQRLGALVLDATLWPYMQLWLELASLAARGDPLCRTTGEQIGRGFLAWISAQLDSPDPETDAAGLLLALEGALLLKSLGLEDVARRGIRHATSPQD